MSRNAGQGFETPVLNAVFMTFDNGFTVSIQWKMGNYCENRDNRQANTLSPSGVSVPCSDAEVAVFDADDEMVGSESGWQSPEEVAALLADVATWTAKP